MTTTNLIDRYYRHRQAVFMSRFWWNRYRKLHRWRWYAKRDALAQARLWGLIAKYSHDEAI